MSSLRLVIPKCKLSRGTCRLPNASGYKSLEASILPAEAWVDGYYEILEPRAKALLDHPNDSVREFASETLREIEVFGQSEGSYGYVFYVLQRI